MWVFTYTKHNMFFEAFVAKKFIFTSFSPQALQAIMNRQKDAIKITLKDNPKFNPRALLIWDDYNGKDIKYNESLDSYYYTGRHYHTMNFFNAQYVKLTPPAIRCNTDVAVLFNTDHRDSIEEYWKDFAGKMSKDEFFDMFRRCTEDVEHGCIVINNDPNIHYEEKFFYAKAEEVANNIHHIVGCKEMWDDNEEQLHDIKTGTVQKELKLIEKLSKPKRIHPKHNRVLQSNLPTRPLMNGKLLEHTPRD